MRLMLPRFTQLAPRLGRPRAGHMLVACGLFIGLALAAAVTWYIITLRQAVIEDAVREMRNDALILAEDEDRLLLAIGHLRCRDELLAAETARTRAEADLALAEQHARAAHTLHLQERRFDTALQNMAQGLIMVGHDGTLLVSNRRVCEIWGLPPDTVTPGMSYT